MLSPKKILPPFLLVLVLFAIYLAPRLLFPEQDTRSVANNLTWLLGVLVQSSALILAASYFLSGPLNYKLKSGWASPSEGESLDSASRKSNSGIFIVAFILLYLLELILLWFGLANGDHLVLDRAIIVILIAVLFAGARVGLVVALFAAMVRAAIIFMLEAEPHAINTLFNHPLSVPRLIYSERWIFYEPGVVSLLAAAILAGLVYYYYRPRDLRFPIWIGFPIAILLEALYNALVYQLWGVDDFVYLTLNEALPNILGLGFSTSVFLLIVRSQKADDERQRAQAALLALSQSELALSQAELALMQSKLRYLQAQINPHFLFNSLNTIQYFIHDDPDHARELLLHLSDMFRRIVYHRAPFIPLREELEHTDAYLALEKGRLGERLTIVSPVDQTTLDIEVPFLILQPIVENAIKHGIAPKEDGGTVTIAIKDHVDAVTLTVTDDGVGMMRVPKKSSGVGMANVDQRLRTVYGEAAALQIESQWGEGTTVTITIPKNGPHPPNPPLPILGEGGARGQNLSGQPYGDFRFWTRTVGKEQSDDTSVLYSGGGR